MKNTQLSESLNADLKEHLRSDYNLIQFFTHFKMAGDVYTKTIFEKFQDEYVGSLELFEMKGILCSHVIKASELEETYEDCVQEGQKLLPFVQNKFRYWATLENKSNIRITNGPLNLNDASSTRKTNEGSENVIQAKGLKKRIDPIRGRRRIKRCTNIFKYAPMYDATICSNTNFNAAS
ncbi:hypothetical protein CsSME_00016742 [Camellia sinensis var. sinensis]